MRIFITGGSGFIGGYVVQRLARDGHELVCLARKTSQTGGMRAAGAQVFNANLDDLTALTEGMRGCQALIHLANIYSFWEKDKNVFHRVNVEGTRIVMQAAMQAGVQKVIHVSTAVIYGKPDECPYREESPFGPERFSAYAQSKYEGDRIVWDLYENEGLPVVGIYPAAVVGAGDLKASGMFVVNVIKHRLPAVGLKHSRITFVPVRDTAESIALALFQQENIGQRYLIGKYAITLDEYLKTISEISGARLPQISLPDWMVVGLARLLTWSADRTGIPPLWGMSNDQTRTFLEGFECDGSKAARDLGLVYTPLRPAFEEAVKWVKEQL
jgi:dihydroflavonol-4-reductase